MSGDALSGFMLEILRFVALRPDEEGAKVEHLVAAIAGGLHTRVVRASLSRALRRLWRRGLVELHTMQFGYYGECFSQVRANAEARLQGAEADPAGRYADACALLGEDFWGSVEGYLEVLREKATETPRLRVVRVTLTARGESS